MVRSSPIRGKIHRQSSSNHLSSSTPTKTSSHHTAQAFVSSVNGTAYSPNRQVTTSANRGSPSGKSPTLRTSAASQLKSNTKTAAAAMQNTPLDVRRGVNGNGSGSNHTTPSHNTGGTGLLNYKANLTGVNLGNYGQYESPSKTSGNIVSGHSGVKVSSATKDSNGTTKIPSKDSTTMGSKDSVASGNHNGYYSVNKGLGLLGNVGQGPYNGGGGIQGQQQGGIGGPQYGGLQHQIQSGLTVSTRNQQNSTVSQQQQQNLLTSHCVQHQQNLMAQQAQQQQAAAQQQAQQQAAQQAQQQAQQAAQQQQNPEEEFPDLCTDRYQVIRFIGSGGEGAVYEAYDRITRSVCALKVGNKNADTNARKDALKEMTLYYHLLKWPKLNCIPKLLDCRVKSLMEHAEQTSGRKENSTAQQRNYLIQHLGNHCGLNNIPKDLGAPDYLSISLFGPSLRMMLQSFSIHKFNIVSFKSPPYNPKLNPSLIQSIYCLLPGLATPFL